MMNNGLKFRKIIADVVVLNTDVPKDLRGWRSRGDKDYIC